MAALAVTPTGWLRHLALDGQPQRAESKTLRYRLFAVPARYITYARTKILKLPDSWAWTTDVINAWARIHALHPA